MIKIRKSSDPIEVPSIKILIYGQPGLGKTSLGFSAHRPLLLDFDQGSYRSHFRKDDVPVTSWADIASMDENDIRDYDTIVLDTVGRALDFLTADLIKRNPKLAQSSGALSLKGYGELKASFAQWIKRLTTMGKNIVMLAHDKEDKNGDDLLVRPDIQGGSYAEAFKIADGIGYLHSVNKSRVLDFNPTDSWAGKNPAQLEPLQVPHLSQDPEFLGNLIGSIKDSLGAISVEGRAIAEAVETCREEIAQIENAEGMNAFYGKLATLAKPAQIQAKHLMQARCKELEIAFNKDAQQFEASHEAA